MTTVAAGVESAVYQVCSNGAGAAAKLLSEACGTAFSWQVGELEEVSSAGGELELPRPALVLLATVAKDDVALVLPHPERFAKSLSKQDGALDPARRDKLAADVLEALLGPLGELQQPTAVVARDLAQKLAGRPLRRIPLTIEGTIFQGQGQLLWPVPPGLLFSQDTEKRPTGEATLPQYSRSLLQIRVPVRATLATTRLPVHKIVQLVHGSIIQFDKACDDVLELEVGEETIAVGEAVKVGDKFGLRITSMAAPRERFHRVLTAGEKQSTNGE